MQLLSKFNHGIRFLLCFIDIFSRYVWVVPLKDETGITITDAPQKMSNESGRKPNKRWVDEGSKYYKKLLRSRLEKTDIEIYPTHDEGKSVVFERFIRDLGNKKYKYVTLISKDVYIDQSSDINLKLAIMREY